MLIGYTMNNHLDYTLVSMTSGYPETNAPSLTVNFFTFTAVIGLILSGSMLPTSMLCPSFLELVPFSIKENDDILIYTTEEDLEELTYS